MMYFETWVKSFQISIRIEEVKRRRLEVSGKNLEILERSESCCCLFNTS